MKYSETQSVVMMPGGVRVYDSDKRLVLHRCVFSDGRTFGSDASRATWSVYVNGGDVMTVLMVDEGEENTS